MVENNNIMTSDEAFGKFDRIEPGIIKVVYDDKSEHFIDEKGEEVSPGIIIE